MPFNTDSAYAQAVGDFYGKYRTTFTSLNGQVHAHLFEQGEWLVAYVTYDKGLDAHDVTDPYLADLHRFAKESGHEHKLRLLQAVS